MVQGKTNIQVETELWKKLNQMKEPGETFNEIINCMLKVYLKNIEGKDSIENIK